MKNSFMFSVKHFYNIPPPHGGISVFVRRLTNCLNRMGVKAGAFYYKKRHMIDAIPKPFQNKFSLLPILRIWWLPIALIQLLVAFRGYKIIHSHYGIRYLPHILAIYLLTRKKIVITNHDEMLRVNYINVKWYNKMCLKMLTKYKVIQWIAVSDNVKSEMKKMSFEFGNVPVIPAFVPPEDSILSEDALPREMLEYVKKYDFVISMYCHSLDMEYKGKDVYGCKTALAVLRDVRRSINACLVICITNVGKQGNINTLKELAKEMKIDQDIFWQLKPLVEAWPLWKISSVHIRPTFTDGDSVALRESLYVGTPTIASDVTKRPNGAITYRYGDSSELTAKVIEVLKQKKRDCSNVKNNEGVEKMCELYRGMIYNEQELV